MRGSVLLFGAGEGVTRVVEFGERMMKEEGGKIMGHCFTSGAVIIMKCEVLSHYNVCTIQVNDTHLIFLSLQSKKTRCC